MQIAIQAKKSTNESSERLLLLKLIVSQLAAVFNQSLCGTIYSIHKIYTDCYRQLTSSNSLSRSCWSTAFNSESFSLADLRIASDFAINAQTSSSMSTWSLTWQTLLQCCCLEIFYETGHWFLSLKNVADEIHT
jgi:hypothetical protein